MRPLNQSNAPEPASASSAAALIWIDLDNTPHVPFFRPIIRELKNRGYRVVVTARDAFQVCDLARKLGVEFIQVGRHYGRNRVMKVLGLLVRAWQLMPLTLRHRPALGLSHGARSQIFVCHLLRIPSVLIMDYEFTSSPPMTRPDWEIVPDSLPDVGLHARNPARIRKYRGIKEDVYAGEFRPDPSILDQLHLRDCQIVVTARPPATEAHYHNPESEQLFELFMNRAVQTPGIRVVLLPRNKRQEEALRQRSPDWFSGGKVIVPSVAVDGLNLLWHSDLVVSGGGTMNREAAALGIPVYSIFRGKIGAVDRRLADEGRLILIESPDDVHCKILLQPRHRTIGPQSEARPAMSDIIRHVDSILASHSH